MLSRAMQCQKPSISAYIHHVFNAKSPSLSYFLNSSVDLQQALPTSYIGFAERLQEEVPQQTIPLLSGCPC